MRENRVKLQVNEIVRETVRQEGLVQTAGAMELLPELVGAVEFDLERFQSIITAELNKKTGNPLNILLGLLGLRIISTRDPLRTLGLEEEDARVISDQDSAAAGRMGAMLKLNTAAFEAAAGKMAETLGETEKQAEDRRQAVRSESSQLYQQLEHARQSYSQLTIDHNSQINAVLERVQYMLSLCGQDARDDPMARQLTELLEDLDVQVYWTHQDGSFPEYAMFTALKCEDTTRRREKPCLANGQNVLLKGVKFLTEG